MPPIAYLIMHESCISVAWETALFLTPNKHTPSSCVLQAFSWLKCFATIYHITLYYMIVGFGQWTCLTLFLMPIKMRLLTAKVTFSPSGILWPEVSTKEEEQCIGVECKIIFLYSVMFTVFKDVIKSSDPSLICLYTRKTACNTTRLWSK